MVLLSLRYPVFLPRVGVVIRFFGTDRHYNLLFRCPLHIGLPSLSLLLSFVPQKEILGPRMHEKIT